MAKWGTRQGAVMQGHLKEGHLAWLGIHGKVGYQTGCCDARAPKRGTSSMVRDTWQSGVPDMVL